MLRTLRIRNLAVIEAVEVDLDPGFTALTGETGAGKSILVEAVGLLLGGRASADLVRTGTDAATIEAVFERPDGSEVLIRREITAAGRSRSNVNGALATASMLRDVSADLVELHGQHEHQLLLDASTHLGFLDADAGLEAAAADVASLYARVRELRDRLAGASMDARERAARLELVRFQLAEIDAVKPAAAEDAELEAAQRVLANAERVDGLCRTTYGELYDDERAALTQLVSVWRKVEELAGLDPAFAPHLEARGSMKAQLEDLASFLRTYADGVDASPAKLQQVDDRLARIERLKRKYGPTLEEVIARGQALRAEVARLTGGDEESGDIERQLAAASTAYLAAARELSQARRRAAIPFAKGLKALLADLAMAETRFDVRFESIEAEPDRWEAQGIDRVEFYVSPNPGEDPRPLARIASGGELSRIMLALRTHGTRRPERGSAQAGGRKTLIFDEVDAGIGGRAAEAVGALLRELGARYQVLCITHLAPIAARATTQCAVEKRVTGGRTVTAVTPLGQDQRVDELARMLAGSRASEATRASARELLGGGGMGAKVKQAAKGESESRRPRA
ncbi:MAG TPA: DNA repair protein RecN [Vicinamibacterales bacterium]|jgi:DNA repair protein RecN (Recombination protein N)|nr:DNA repair protein RecN [Vicinamibacterales bacterium]